MASNKDAERNEKLFDAILKVALEESVNRDMEALPSQEELDEMFPRSEAMDRRVMDKLINEQLRNSGSVFYKIKLKKGGTMLLFLPRVLYFESYSHDISAVLENETHIFIGSITNLAEELKNMGFIRISQSYLVNIENVFNVSGNQVTIKNGNELTAGRSHKQALNEALANRDSSKT